MKEKKIERDRGHFSKDLRKGFCRNILLSVYILFSIFFYLVKNYKILCFSTVVVQDIPFSLNYSQMIDKCEMQETHQTKSITSAEAEEQLENIKKTAGVDTLDRLGNLNSISFLTFLPI